jgi:hypothetical protein
MWPGRTLQAHNQGSKAAKKNQNLAAQTKRCGGITCCRLVVTSSIHDCSSCKKLMSRVQRLRQSTLHVCKRFPQATAQVKLQTQHIHWMPQVTCAAANATSSALDILSSLGGNDATSSSSTCAVGDKSKEMVTVPSAAKLTSLQGGKAAK